MNKREMKAHSKDEETVNQSFLNGSNQVTDNLKGAEPIIAELRAAGFAVQHITDLRNSQTNYRSAIPILVHWLQIIENRGIKQELVSVLGTKFARPSAAPILIEQFKKAQIDDLNFKWAIAESLSLAAHDIVYTEIVELIRDKKHGKAREMLALALANMRNPEVVDVLIDLISDEDMTGHVIRALGKLRPEKAKPFIEPYLYHNKSWIRREAKRAIAKIA